MSPSVEAPLTLRIGIDLVVAQLGVPAADAIVVSGSELLREYVVAVMPDVASFAAFPTGAYVGGIVWLPTVGDPLTVPRTLLRPGGRAGVIAPGVWGEVTSTFRLERWSGRRAALGAFAQVGWREEMRVGIGSPRSVVWALLSRLAERGGRLDLADRLEYQYRRSLTPRRGARLTDVCVLVARRSE
jgi:hypothetical protein